jgi:hypothetical protein
MIRCMGLWKLVAAPLSGADLQQFHKLIAASPQFPPSLGDSHCTPVHIRHKEPHARPPRGWEPGSGWRDGDWSAAWDPFLVSNEVEAEDVSSILSKDVI